MEKTTNLDLNKPELSDDADIRELNKNADALDSAIGDLQGRTDTLETNVSSLQGSSSSQGADISSLKSTVATHTSQIGSLQATDRTHASDIASNRSNIATNASDIAELKTTVKSHGDDISDLKSSLSGSQGDIGGIQTRLSAVEQKASANASNISGHTTQINGLLTDVSVSKAKIEKNASDIAELKRASGNVPTYSRATTTSDGLMPRLSGNAKQDMRGDGTWANIPYLNPTYSYAHYLEEQDSRISNVLVSWVNMGFAMSWSLSFRFNQNMSAGSRVIMGKLPAVLGDVRPTGGVSLAIPVHIVSSGTSNYNMTAMYGVDGKITVDMHTGIPSNKTIIVSANYVFWNTSLIGPVQFTVTDYK